MAARDWEDMKDRVCTHLEIDSNTGEMELDTITRLIRIERQKHADLCTVLESILSTAAFERECGLATKQAPLLKWRNPTNETRGTLTTNEKPTIS
jgi:hypothetical protein